MFELQTSKMLARMARWGLIGAVMLMGAALVATVWSTSRSVDSASDTLVRAQATVFRSAIRSYYGRLRRPLTEEELREALDQLSEDGLRYIAILEPASDAGAGAHQPGDADPQGAAGNGIQLEVGDPPPDRDRLALAIVGTSRGEIVQLDNRYRVYYGVPPNRRGRARRIPAMVLEFQPRVVETLRGDAQRGLIAGALAAVALLVIAIALVRWFLRREALERDYQERLARERRLASLGEMSAVLAHEIRNPIASLKGNAQLLVRMLPDEGKPRAKAQRLVGESQRLETLTNDLLEFARAGVIERTPVDPVALLHGAVAERVTEHVEVQTVRAPDSWSMDGARIQQVLTNLVNNACEATETRTGEADDDGEPWATVTVGRLPEGDTETDGARPSRAARAPTALVYTIRDRGDGIPDEDLDRIFEPFFTRKTRGTGLGLAVARRMVELHGGTLTAANADGGGAVFRVIIPVSSDEA